MQSNQGEDQGGGGGRMLSNYMMEPDGYNFKPFSSHFATEASIS